MVCQIVVLVISDVVWSLEHLSLATKRDRFLAPEKAPLKATASPWSRATGA